MKIDTKKMSLADELRALRAMTSSPVLHDVIDRAAAALEEANGAFHKIVAGIRPRIVSASEGVRAVEAARGWNECSDEVRRIVAAALRAGEVK